MARRARGRGFRCIGGGLAAPVACLAVAAGLAAFAAGCDSGDAARAQVDLPPYPSWTAEGLVVDAEAVRVAADRYCRDAADPSDAATFYFGTLPAEAFGELCGGLAPAEVSERLGRLFLSGWYGGLWFRDHADFGMGPGGPSSGPVTEADFRDLADNAAVLAQQSRNATAEEVQAANRLGLLGPGQDVESMMDSLLTVFAYNWGYVQAVLAKAPEGVPPPAFPCGAYLDCGLAGTPLAAYDGYRSVLARLDAPTNDRWTELADEVWQREPFVDIGRSLWEQGSIAPESWATLAGLNEGYLRVTSAASLAAMAGYADRDQAAGRCALLLEAGADTWNGGYFLGIRSDAPEGTMPGLHCPL